MEPIISTLADIKKAIINTHNAITNVTAQQNLLQNQYTQAKVESKFAHEEALKAAYKSDQPLAMQALSQEVFQEKFANLLQSQIEQQIVVIEILNDNLSALVVVKTALEKCIDNQPNEEKNTQSLIPSLFGEKIDQDLEHQKLSSEDILVARVKKVISTQVSIDVENISLDHSLALGEFFGFFLSSSNNCDYSTNDLNMDKLDEVELLMAIEEEFDIEISDAEAEIIRTVQELVNIISFKLNQKKTS